MCVALAGLFLSPPVEYVEYPEIPEITLEDLPTEKVALYYNLDDPLTAYILENGTFVEVELNGSG